MTSGNDDCDVGMRLEGPADAYYSLLERHRCRPLSPGKMFLHDDHTLVGCLRRSTSEMEQDLGNPLDAMLVESGPQQEIPPHRIAMPAAETSTRGEAPQSQRERRTDIVRAEQHVGRPRRAETGVRTTTVPVDEIVVPVHEIDERVP